jgi:hypothetical protein
MHIGGEGHVCSISKSANHVEPAERADYVARQMANARLISAAPDLLEALKPLARLADVFDRPGGTTPTSGEIYTWSRMVDGEPTDFTLTVEMLQAARAAAAKAEGRQP